jgi:hypothetical protein
MGLWCACSIHYMRMYLSLVHSCCSTRLGSSIVMTRDLNDMLVSPVVVLCACTSCFE